MTRSGVVRWTRLFTFLFALGLLAACQPAQQAPPGAEEDTMAPVQPDTMGMEL